MTKTNRDIEKLRQDLDLLSELNAHREGIIQMVVHELKSPLSNIEYAMSELSVEIEQANVSLENLPQIQALKTLISDSIAVMNELIEDMLTVAQINSVRHRRQDDIELLVVLELILSSATLKARAKNIDLTYSIPPELPMINGDAFQIRLLLENLLSNAVKYTPRGGKVRLDVHTTAETITIRVADSGVGMTQDDITNAFQEFKRLSGRPTAGESSTGLGLYISRKIAEFHSASLKIESDGKNKGTTFVLELLLQTHHDVDHSTQL